jgi:CspA family cold shock protein
MTVSQSLVHNRRAFLRIGMLATGAAVLAACGATAANTGLTNEERAAYEAQGDEIAAAIAADTTPKVKIKGSVPCGTSDGTLKFYSESKGFGFIVPSGGKQDVMVLRQSIVSGQSLREGTPVKFTYGERRRGMIMAENVCEN